MHILWSSDKFKPIIEIVKLIFHGTSGFTAAIIFCKFLSKLFLK